MTPVLKKLSAAGKGCTSAHALHQVCTTSAVNVVLSIIDEDGKPEPMIDRKQVQKIQNGADRFYAEHQAEYETRVKPSRDRVMNVEQHIFGYPKLQKELDKRKSIRKPTTQSSADKAPRELPPRCPSCGRFLKREKKLESKIKPYKRNNRNHSRVTKHRTKPLRIRSATRSIIRAATNKSCQYVAAKQYNVSTRTTKMDTSSIHRPSCSVEQNDTTVLFERTSKSNDGSGNTNKSNPSISNYSSFSSIEHEPMVSP